MRSNEEKMISVYIHIPFCTNICSYCDFTKFYKNDQWIDKYLIALEKEIKQYYAYEKVKTLYFGGGTPSSLSLKQLEKLFEITNIFDLDENAEISFECNVEDLTEEKLQFLSTKVNRLSIGVQSFNHKYLDILGRKNINIYNILMAKKYFDNINVDLMYGFKGQTLKELRQDIDLILRLEVNHISAYSLMIEPHTKLYINEYKAKEDDRFDKLIEKEFSKNGYKHYEISNYAKEGYESKHNLTYWNNDHYYGFGLGASGYIGNKRYDNTKNLTKYLTGDYRSVINLLEEKEIMQNEFILGFRKLEGINKAKFKNKYNMDIKEVKEVKKLLKQKLLLENEDYIYINPDYIYVSNEILINFI